MNILFTLCGRAGSKGLKNKNIKKLCGIPLVYYTLAVIAQYADKNGGDKVYVAVNTDSEELYKMVKGQKRITNIYRVGRKEELAGDAAAKVDVIRDTYQSLNDLVFPDVVMDLDITSPFRTVGDIENVLAVYNENKDCDLIFTVVKARRNPYFNMVEKKVNGFYGKVCKPSYTARQQTPEIFELNASIYAYRPGFLDTCVDKSILEYCCGISMMKDYLVLDIDSERDHEMMQVLMPYYRREDEELNTMICIAQAMYLKES